MKYIFLDFDGVLHGKEYKKELFQHSPIFCEYIRPYKDNIRIIISSSWREDYTLDILTHHLDIDLQPLIIGITPSHIEGMNYCGRFNEIKEYCTVHSISDRDWIALDDMARLFPIDCPNLILINPIVGLTPKNLSQLINFITEQDVYRHTTYLIPK